MFTNEKTSLTPRAELEKRIVELADAKGLLEREIEGCRWSREELWNREEQYRILMETMNDGLIMRDENGLITYVNQRFCDLLGYSKEELTGHPVNDFLDEENRNIVEEQIVRRKKGSQDDYELTLTARDGRKIPTIISPKPIFDPDGKFRGSFAVVTDITRLKRIEEELRESERKLRFLSSHLLKFQEKEGERISRELHDELGQDLTVLKYQIRFILRKLRKDQKILKESGEDALEHLDRIVDQVRQISRGLSPSALKRFGLTAALQRMVEDFSKHSNTKAGFQAENIDHIFSEDAQVNLYRIFREALTNAARHAEATSISLGIEKKDHQVRCWLEDDGKGFDLQRVEAAISSRKGLGLITMEERARMLGGTLAIRTRQGGGTRILLTVPLYGRGEA